jgi:hypothetical protein
MQCGGKMENELITVEQFLKSHSTARIQIGTRNMSYIDNESLFIVYDIREPHNLICKWTKFGYAWERFVEK